MNECGECKECCIALPVCEPELKKKAGVPCGHLCADGCSIYRQEGFPQLCKIYLCGWRQNKYLGKRIDYRPDKLGVIFQDNGDRLNVFETRTGALSNPQVKWAISRIREKRHRLLKIHPFGVGWEEFDPRDYDLNDKYEAKLPECLQWEEKAGGEMWARYKEGWPKRTPLTMAS